MFSRGVFFEETRNEETRRRDYLKRSIIRSIIRLQNYSRLLVSSFLASSKKKKRLGEVLAAGWQLVVLERGQNLLELEEETLAGGVAVGVHVEANRTKGTVPAVSSGADYRGTVPKVFQVLEQLAVLSGEQRGGGDGDGLVAG